MYYVYLLQSELGDIYLGFTQNLKRRLSEHNSGRSGYTRGKVWKLVYYESYLSQADALNREKQLKQYGQALAKLKQRLSNSLGKS